MGAIILKITTRGDRAHQIHKLGGAEITIGRAFDNDIIVDNPFVSPHQFRLKYEGDGLMLTIIDPVNPVFVNQRLVNSAACAISLGQVIAVGKTQIRVIGQHEEVAPTKQLFMSNWSQTSKISPLIAILTVLICSAVDSAFGFFHSSIDLQWRDPAYMTIFSAAMLVVWAGAWAIAGRVFKHQSLFYVQLFLTSAVSGVFIFIFPLAEYIDFLSTEVVFGEAANYLLALLFFFSLLKINLAVATNVQNTTRAALLCSVFLVGVVFASVRYYTAEFDSDQNFPATLKPPLAAWRNTIPVDDYFADLAEIDIPIEK